jgi:serine/threonine-protein kinase
MSKPGWGEADGSVDTVAREQWDATAPTMNATPSVPAPVDVGAPSLPVDDGARYEPKGVLGRGGMGEVRLCADRRIGRDVAMKVMRGKEAVERFLREARVQGQLEHPAITPVYDLGVAPDGNVYFTMKRVRGRTLEQVLEGLRAGDPELVEKYSRRKLLTALSTVCLAVDFAHQRGVVHRDLKPANIMLGDFGEVNVLDWGLAKLVDGTDSARPSQAPAPTDSRETLAGAVLGTPGYMAPEQIEAGLGPVGPAADVYTLGAVLFEILTLEPLHERGPVLALMGQTLRGADARASVRFPERDVPPELEQICVRATTKAWAERFESARELNEALERYLDGDRDLELRRDLAEQHATRGIDYASAAASKTGGAFDTRRAALREIGRALALDPDNPRAVGTMIDLLMRPPEKTPAEVEEELAELERAQVRMGGRIGTLAYLSMNLYVPIFLWLGVRSWTALGLLVFFSLGAAFAAWLVSRWQNARSAMPVLAVSTAAAAATAGLFGPLVLVPSIAAANTLVYAISNSRRVRGAVLSIGPLAILVPLALEWLGLVPPSYRFTDEGMLILPRMTGLPETPTIFFLVLASVGVVVTAALAAAPFRDQLDKAQHDVRLHAWQLRQLVPERALANAKEG